MEDREIPLTLDQEGIHSNPLLDHLAAPDEVNILTLQLKIR
ncbi:hypothetical protein [uncultured Shewanella sp.]|nr:hypothetical protein [uncultured Shewanella sp.]